MDKLEKVERICEKCGVSYEDAKAALDACNDDMLDAIIWLERAGKTNKQTAHYTTKPPSQEIVSPEMVAAQAAYEKSSRKSDFSQHMSAFWDAFKNLLHKSVDTKFVATRNGKEFFSLPVIIPIAGIFLWGATIWLLIIGLFFNIRYHLEDTKPITVDVNDAMDKIADAAETLKKDVTGND